MSRGSNLSFWLCILSPNCPGTSYLLEIPFRLWRFWQILLVDKFVKLKDPTPLPLRGSVKFFIVWSGRGLKSAGSSDYELWGRGFIRCIVLDTTLSFLWNHLMRRQARLDVPGTLHHIMVRAINRSAIFEDDQDRPRPLGRLGQNIVEAGCCVYVWVLMENHLLERSDRPGIATLIRKLLSWCAQYYNRRHQRTGHLFLWICL